MPSNIALQIYEAYPRKVGKRDALRSIERALRRLPQELAWEGSEEDLDFWLLSRVELYAKTPAGNRGYLTPHPSTWFNQSRYLDDEKEWDELAPKELERLQQSMNANLGVWRPQ